ncbi:MULTISPECIES: hypothetical protein [unclassified Pseudomonas]|uniref:hypothetical protein n=1 Tax=unclassified Pseudomonas TaxID=196821 RepID=UPI0025F9A58F|nr:MULTISPECIES: hypothetical protein [unclassified Pseudomonas]
MTAISLKLKTDLRSEAEFRGKVEPEGDTGYKFSGDLTASCKLDRKATGFDNIVRLGHGSSSGEYTYLEFKLVGDSNNTFIVRGQGTRAAEDSVDFRLGINEGFKGSYIDGSKVTVDIEEDSTRSSPLESYVTAVNSKIDLSRKE